MMHAPSLTPPLLCYAPPQDPYLPVIHEDHDLIVIDKPSGLLSVPGKAEDHWDCAEYRAQKLFGDVRIVHRLDMDTSGLMVLARHAESHKFLGQQFEKRLVEKSYLARVWGQLAEDAGQIDLPLICDWPNRPKQMVCFERGKKALTDWQVLHRDEQSSLVRLVPHTGRSHQLRVHMLSLGHAILGDRFYAQGLALAASERLLLHAAQLAFTHPTTGVRVAFSSACSFADRACGAPIVASNE